MKRRHFVGSIPFLFATPELFGQAITNIQQIPKFFTSQQLAALRHLSDIILPSIGGSPGALDAGAPEFLDFLVSQSPTPTKNLYRTGLDTLNTRATTKYGKAFAAVSQAEADELLSPLRDAWTYEEPRDPFAQFLRHAKADVLTATLNSREWLASTKRSGNGAYWLPPE
jgi:hypothetical protein